MLAANVDIKTTHPLSSQIKPYDVKSIWIDGELHKIGVVGSVDDCKC